MENGRLANLAKGVAENAYLRVFSQLAMTVAAPTLVWTASALWDLNRQQAIVSGRIDGVQIRIESMMDNRYRSTDAERDFRLRDQIITFLKDRIDRQEKQLDALERRSRPLN